MNNQHVPEMLTPKKDRARCLDVRFNPTFNRFQMEVWWYWTLANKMNSSLFFTEIIPFFVYINDWVRSIKNAWLLLRIGIIHLQMIHLKNNKTTTFPQFFTVQKNLRSSVLPNPGASLYPQWSPWDRNMQQQELHSPQDKNEDRNWTLAADKAKNLSSNLNLSSLRLEIEMSRNGAKNYCSNHKGILDPPRFYSQMDRLGKSTSFLIGSIHPDVPSMWLDWRHRTFPTSLPRRRSSVPNKAPLLGGAKRRHREAFAHQRFRDWKVYMFQWDAQNSPHLSRGFQVSFSGGWIKENDVLPS